MNRRSRSRDDRGAIAVLTGILMVLIVIAASFAVDLGTQRVLRSDLQALTDAVSLDAARLLDGRTAGDIRAGSNGKLPLATVVAASAQRNESTIVGTVATPVATLVSITTGSNGEAVPVRNADGSLMSVADGVVPDAVVVTAQGSVSFAFRSGSGTAVRSSMANAASFACFRLGSFAAQLKSNGSAVGGVFESMIGDALGFNLSAISYQGLLNSSVGLPALAAQLGVASPQALASVKNITVARLLTAAAAVLTSQGDTNASTLGLIAGRVDQSLVLDLGQVLSVGGGSAAASSINAIDLLGSVGLAASTVVANNNNFLDTGVAWSAPHVSSGDIALTAIQAPQQYCGPIGGSTSTAQVQFGSSFGFNLPNSLKIGSLGTLSVGTQADPSNTQGVINVNASLAGATGTLVGARCGAGTVADPQQTKVNVDTQLLTTSVSVPFRIKGNLDVSASTIVPSSLLSSLFGVLSLGTTVTLTLDLQGSQSATVSTPAQTATAPTVYSVLPLTYGQALGSAGSPVQLPTASTVLDLANSSATITVKTLLGAVTVKTANVGALDLTQILSAVSSSVIGTSTADVVTNLNQALVPVSQLLGIRVGGADLIVNGAPSCSRPSLIG